MFISDMVKLFFIDKKGRMVAREEWKNKVVGENFLIKDWKKEKIV